MPEKGRTAPKEVEKQPPQTSGPRDPAHEHEPTVRKGYEDAQGPEKQGDGDPGTDPVSEPSPQKNARPSA